MSKTKSILNSCFSEFKRNFKNILNQNDLKDIKSNFDSILQTVEPYSIFIDKELDFYKSLIFSEFSIIVLKNIKKDLKSRTKVDTRESFKDYISNFWIKNPSIQPIEPDGGGWGGGGLIISNNKDWIGDPESDISIYTNDYRFVLFTEEVYRLCHDITNYCNKYYFFERIGLILKSHLKENSELVMTVEIFDELCNSVWEFINKELDFRERLNITFEEKLSELKKLSLNNIKKLRLSILTYNDPC